MTFEKQWNKYVCIIYLVIVLPFSWQFKVMWTTRTRLEPSRRLSNPILGNQAVSTCHMLLQLKQLLRLNHVTVYSTALRKTTPHPFSLYHCINRQGNTWLSQQCWVHSLSYFHLCVSFSYSVPAPEKKGSMQHSKIVLSAWDRAAFGFIKNLFREGKLHRLFIWFGFLN